MSEAPVDRRYIASLTGLRGIAAFSVFLFHYAALHPGIRLDLSIPVLGYFLQLPLGLGFAGVDLFFVLSGFLLSLPFARASLGDTARPAVRRYMSRRLLRVFPAYYAQWAIIMLAGAWFVTWKPLDGYALAAHFFMFFNIGPEPVKPIVGLWWTLPVELSFYLLLPLLAPLMKPRRWGWLLAAGIVTSLVYRSWAAAHFADHPGDAAFLAASQLPGSLPEFLIGASAALLAQQRALAGKAKPTAKQVEWMFVAGAVAVFLWLSQVVVRFGPVYWDGHWSMVIAPTVLGASLSVIVLSLYWGSRIGKALFANPVVYFIGLVSYSLYLWHFPAMQQLQKVGGEAYLSLPGPGKFLLCTALVTAVAAASYLVFERPFFRLRGQRKTG
ncbi:MAG: acyltransferase [Xanthomonadales bacterium]|nr:acyltransferase [Xanthomonadales bacterium]NNL96453.1 acyltransferase [Xanthomonadales bacterium]